MNILRNIITLILLFTPWVAHAEVMDKEPGLMSIWVTCLFGMTIAFLSAYITKWIGIIVLPPIMLDFYALIMEVLDPFAGPAILHEAGYIYVISAYAAPLLVIISVITAFYLKRKIGSKMRLKKLLQLSAFFTSSSQHLGLTFRYITIQAGVPSLA